MSTRTAARPYSAANPTIIVRRDECTMYELLPRAAVELAVQPDPHDPSSHSVVGHAVAWEFPHCDWLNVLDDFDSAHSHMTDILVDLHQAGHRFTTPGPVLYIERVTIDEQWRGLDWGLDFVRDMIASLGTFAGVVCWPAPIGHYPDHDEGERACARLGAHWSRLGFTPIGDTAWGLDLAATPPVASTAPVTTLAVTYEEEW